MTEEQRDRLSEWVRLIAEDHAGSCRGLNLSYEASVSLGHDLSAALATIARLEAEDEAEWKPIWKYTGCGPVLVSTAPDSPKYLASEAVTAFRDVTGVWRCHGSVGGHAELAKEPTHFREAPRRPRLSSRAKDQSQ